MLVEKIARRLHGNDILLTSDKLKAYPMAIRIVFAKKKPPKSARGAGPSTLYPKGLLYGQVVKVEEHGHLRCVERKPVIGTDKLIQAKLTGDKLCEVINTSIVERDNLSVRQHQARLVRKTLSYSKDLEMHIAAVEFEDAVQNFIRPHQALRLLEPGAHGRKWKPRTPAMAIGITDHIWSFQELVSYRPPSRL